VPSTDFNTSPSCQKAAALSLSLSIHSLVVNSRSVTTIANPLLEPPISTAFRGQPMSL
jgi:hypothetical protein